MWVASVGRGIGEEDSANLMNPELGIFLERVALVEPIRLAI